MQKVSTAPSIYLYFPIQSGPSLVVFVW
jgi:hypothetical protein